MEQELCPICIENPAENYTECNHSFCIGCLCRITKCAMCRKSLLKAELCREIKQNFERKMNSNSDPEIESLSDISIYEEEYINYENSIVNQLDEYSPFISNYGQFPSDPIIDDFSIIPRWSDDTSITRQYLNRTSNHNLLVTQYSGIIGRLEDGLSYRPSRIPHTRHYDWLNIN
jgi:hypothetical protein